MNLSAAITESHTASAFAGGDGQDNEEMRAQKKAKMAPLHVDYSAPLSFLEDAVRAAQTNDSFNISAIGKPFGLAKEAYLRQCYEDIVQMITAMLTAKKGEKKKQLFIIRGSSGVGKSTFLAYFLVRFRDWLAKKTVLCHAAKSAKNNETSSVMCQVWVGGQCVTSGLFQQIHDELNSHLPTTSLIVMDGCSLPLNLENFKGTVLMAASPSLYVKNIEDSVINTRRKSYTMPVLCEEEALRIGSLIGVDEEVVKENFHYMGGVTRYLFEPGSAKIKVLDSVAQVDASSITKMVSMQVSNKATELFMVHELVLWKVDVADNKGYDGPPRFELVSRYAEGLVAKKLAIESAATLKAARQSMAPLSGAEGYAGALFEAYAIRTLQTGGTFNVRSLNGKSDFQLTIPPLREPIVVESNKVTSANVPYDKVRVPDRAGAFLATLLWPTTTNFPTFDCFYFHTDGKCYSLQMTIALTHHLKNSGAVNTKSYFDGLLGSKKPSKYPAVFVVPAEAAATYVVQKFQGNVDRVLRDMTPYFDQWVIGL